MARVLIVEDDSDVRDLLAETLTAAGHDVLVAADGAQGLRVLEEQTPDLLLTDILMPGKGGFEMLQQLHGAPARMKIIAMSGAPAQWIVLGLAKKLGAAKTLSKPFSPSELIGAVETVLGQP